jgi:predicted flap endonuclease-1-like 5' DNA nuclease
MIDAWLAGAEEPAEVHLSSQAFSKIKLPHLPAEHGLAILDKPVAVLAKSFAYPYGLTPNLIERLKASGIETVGQLANTTDRRLDAIDYVGEVKIRRIHDVIYQAIWM